MEQKITIAWKPKEKELLARGAKVLEHRHRNGEMEIAAPTSQGAFVSYKVTETYARILLGECAHHFKLLEPSKLLVPFPNRNGGRDYREVFSVATKKGFRTDGQGEEDEEESTPATGEMTLGAKEHIGPEADKPPFVATNIPEGPATPPPVTTAPPPPPPVTTAPPPPPPVTTAPPPPPPSDF